MLDLAESEGYASVVSWLPDGQSFIVHNVYAFVAVILPRYFKQSKYKSFQRQLNVWCFERVNKGPEKGAYRHPSFVRGQYGLCREMQRKKVKGGNPSQPSPVQLPITLSSSSSASSIPSRLSPVPIMQSSSSLVARVISDSSSAENIMGDLLEHEDDELILTKDSVFQIKLQQLPGGHEKSLLERFGCNESDCASSWCESDTEGCTEEELVDDNIFSTFSSDEESVDEVVSTLLSEKEYVDDNIVSTFSSDEKSSVDELVSTFSHAGITDLEESEIMTVLLR